MKTLIQNQVASSRWTLPATLLWAAVIWLSDGLIAENWWMQAACYVLCTYLMAELNNSNALIRTFTRLVSVSFLMLTCMAGNLGSLKGILTLLSIIATYTALFRTYQDQQAAGWAYYTFLTLALGSLADCHLLLLAPVWWLLMGLALNSLSWRTFTASLLGLATPYWILSGWHIYQGTWSSLANHLKPLTQWSLNTWSIATDWFSTTVAALTFLSGIMGIVHYMRTNYRDKIRIRQYYYCFITLTLIAGTLIFVQPQYHDLLQNLLIVSVAPLVAHFFALTHTRWTNAAFIITTLLVIGLTVYRVWIS